MDLVTFNLFKYLLYLVHQQKKYTNHFIYQYLPTKLCFFFTFLCNKLGFYTHKIVRVRRRTLQKSDVGPGLGLFAQINRTFGPDPSPVQA